MREENQKMREENQKMREDQEQMKVGLQAEKRRREVMEDDIPRLQEKLDVVIQVVRGEI